MVLIGSPDSALVLSDAGTLSVEISVDRGVVKNLESLYIDRHSVLHTTSTDASSGSRVSKQLASDPLLSKGSLW
jgi:hypothetical protein